MSNNITWVLEFDAPGMREPYQVSFRYEMVIGRGGPGSPVDLDLSPFGAIEKGVSRRHAKISAQDGHLYLADMGAANGSTLNDQRLDVNRLYHLNNEDQLILGALRMTVRIISRPSPDDDQTQRRVRRQTAIPGHGEMVLIVEDHIEVAQLFSMMLQRQGFITQISRDANRALHFLRTQQPDAVLLDLMLPGVGGLEVCRYIRRDTRMDHTPVVVVSANQDPVAEAEVLDAGADVFLSKPVNANDLGDIIAEFMNRRKTTTGVKTRLEIDKDATKALDNARSYFRDSSTPVRNDTVAIIVAGYTDRPFTVTLHNPMTFGRATKSNPITHVDLSNYGAKDRGVSRVHMVMTYENGQFIVEDAGSLNGTFVAGEQIYPNEPVPIKSGQEIRLGQLSLFVYFLSDEVREGDDTAVSTVELPRVDLTEDDDQPETDKLDQYDLDEILSETSEPQTPQPGEADPTQPSRSQQQRLAQTDRLNNPDRTKPSREETPAQTHMLSNPRRAQTDRLNDPDDRTGDLRDGNNSSDRDTPDNIKTDNLMPLEKRNGKHDLNGADDE
jgi:CheY-like chemotaxis protein